MSQTVSGSLALGGTLISQLWGKQTNRTTNIPQAYNTTPEDSPEGVSVNSPVTATFDKIMNNSTISSKTFTLKNNNTDSDEPGIATLTGGNMAKFQPSAPLKPSTKYTATITKEAKDIVGNSLAADKVWSFTTIVAPDTTIPIIASKLPDQGASNVDLNPTIKVVFNEKMLETTINKNTIKLFNEVAGEISGTRVLLDPSDKDKKTVIITVSASLEEGKKYTVRVTTGVKDLAGNAIQSQQEWSFTTKQA